MTREDKEVVSMKSIEERAKEFAQNFEIIPKNMDCEGCDTCTKCKDYRKYVDIVTEQKNIDDAILLKLKSAWEKQAQINHDDKLNYQQGYHDASEKFCEWLKINWRKYVYRDRDGGILFGHWESDFRKAMEK